MPSERATGGVRLRGQGQQPGTFSRGGGGSGVQPPAPVTSPAIYAAGSHLFGIPSGVTTVTVEQWGGGGAGNTGAGTATGGQGGGSGAYAKYTLGGALIVPGGKLTITVGAGSADPTATAGLTKVLPSGNPAIYVQSGGGKGGGAGGSYGSNTVNAGTGLVVVTNTHGVNGSTTSAVTGGAGGTAPSGGTGGAGGAMGEPGAAGAVPGAGGGGGGGGVVVTGTGGAGAGGRVKITW